jgi:hypothetical protein
LPAERRAPPAPGGLPPELIPPEVPRRVPFQDQAERASPSCWSRLKDIPGDIVDVFEQELDTFRQLEKKCEERNPPAPGTLTNPLTAARASQERCYQGAG